jgi:hypothetical protein
MAANQIRKGVYVKKWAISFACLLAGMSLAGMSLAGVSLGRSYVVTLVQWRCEDESSGCLWYGECGRIGWCIGFFGRLVDALASAEWT